MRKNRLFFKGREGGSLPDRFPAFGKVWHLNAKVSGSTIGQYSSKPSGGPIDSIPMSEVPGAMGKPEVKSAVSIESQTNWPENQNIGGQPMSLITSVGEEATYG